MLLVIALCEDRWTEVLPLEFAADRTATGTRALQYLRCAKVTTQSCRLLNPETYFENSSYVRVLTVCSEFCKTKPEALPRASFANICLWELSSYSRTMPSSRGFTKFFSTVCASL